MPIGRINVQNVRIVEMNKLTIDKMHELASNRRFRFLSSTYHGMNIKHRWQCDKCQHIWEAIPNSIKRGCGCPKCAGKAYQIEDIKQLAIKNSFELLSLRFTNMTTKHKWRCKDGHEWMATPTKIKRGSGCPICHTYRGEEKCRFIFEQLTEERFPKLNRLFGSRMELDGYCKKLGIAFEYHGKQHYQRIKYWHKSEQDFLEQVNRDKQKKEICQQHDIALLVIPYFEQTEEYVKTLLTKCNVDVIEDVDWSLFKGSAFRLMQTKEAADRINLRCLSSNYVSARFPMQFQCTKCNRQFKSTANDIKNGYGCLRCGGKMKKTVQDTHELAKANNLIFLSTEYVNSRTKHKWRCTKCNNVFLKTPSDVTQGHGCPECGKKKRWETRRYKKELAKQ